MNTKIIVEIPVGDTVCIVDKEFEYLKNYKWSLKNNYASTTMIIDGRRKSFFMHRIIARTLKGMVTDHINGNRLDNRSINLRVCTHGENLKNRKIHKNNKCGFKGVYWDRSRNEWVVSIRHNKKHLTIRGFDSVIDAAKVYNEKVKILHGDFARLNDV